MKTKIFKVREAKVDLYQPQQIKIGLHSKLFDPGPILSKKVDPYFSTHLGVLFSDDCLKILTVIKNDSIDTVFADPPFNLGKIYGKNSNDNLPEQKYIQWCYQWIDECVRILKPGGAFFLYNIPKWNMLFGAYLMNRGLELRHWIAVEMKNGLPITGRLYPSHYSLLYFTKGKPKTFKKNKRLWWPSTRYAPKRCQFKRCLDRYSSSQTLEVQIEK
jgi:site-specific DNA-methyltransferase (adenine-specific)